MLQLHGDINLYALRYLNNALFMFLQYLFREAAVNRNDGISLKKKKVHNLRRHSQDGIKDNDYH